MFGTALGILSGASQGISAISGLFDNSAYERNKARVNQINMKNRQILGDNLKIRGDFINKKITAQENIDNIELASAQARGRARLSLDRAARQSMLDDQSDVRRMFQNLSYQSGSMNTGNRRALLDYSARATQRAQSLLTDRDDFTTSMYDNAFSTQNQIKRQAQQVASSPRYKQYITSYTPERVNQTQRLLNAAGGLAGAVVSGFDTFDKFKRPTDLDGYNPNAARDLNTNLKIGASLDGSFFNDSLGYRSYARQ
jgi:hypothetical protein|tara:strand:- start:318 stop:1082 length:765 start_codon:yes stop_codon:yes gene_type:complete